MLQNDSVRYVMCKQAGSMLLLDTWIFFAQVLNVMKELYGVNFFKEAGGFFLNKSF